MSRAPIGSSFFHAGASVNSATGNPFVALHCTVVKARTGSFSVTLEQGINAAECVALVTFLGPLTIGDVMASLFHTNDIQKTIEIAFGDPGVAFDQDFSFTIERIRTGV